MFIPLSITKTFYCIFKSKNFHQIFKWSSLISFISYEKNNNRSTTIDFISKKLKSNRIF